MYKTFTKFSQLATLNAALLEIFSIIPTNVMAQTQITNCSQIVNAATPALNSTITEKTELLDNSCVNTTKNGISISPSKTLTTPHQLYVITNGTSAHGVNAFVSTINLHNIDIYTNNNRAYGIFAQKKGYINSDGIVNIYTSATTSYETYGVYAEKGEINFTKESSVAIRTEGHRSHGVYAKAIDGGSTEINFNGSVFIDTSITTGSSSMGGYALSPGSKVSFAGSNPDSPISTNIIKTGGNQSYGLFADIEGTINVTGEASNIDGVFTTQIDTTGPKNPKSYNTIAIFADNGSTINFTNGGSVSIETGGNESYGVEAREGSSISFSGITSIDTANADGNNTYGVFADGVYDNKFYNNNKSPIISFQNDLIVSTGGEKSYGIYALGKSKISNTGGKTTINSEGDLPSKIGVYASGVDSTIDLKDLKILTRGKYSSGIRADNMGSIIINEFTEIDTAGDGDATIGVRSTDAGSSVTLNSADIVTGGVGSHGLAADHGGIIKINGSIKVETSGNNSDGVLIDGTLKNSSIILNPNSNVLVTTTGDNSHGIQIDNDSTTHVKKFANIIANTYGNNSDALYLRVDSKQNAIETKITNSVFSAQYGNGITLIGGNHTIDFDSSTVSSQQGLSINATNNSQLTLNIDNNSKIIGGINQDSTSQVDFKISSGSHWNLSIDSNISTITNSGTITMSAEPGLILTVKDEYIGSNGTIILNTSLGDDDSMTDKLIVIGNSTGTTKLIVNNINGLGDATDVGIPIIETNQDSTAIFILDQPIVTSGFQYSLVKGGDAGNANHWYLVSEAVEEPVNIVEEPVNIVEEPVNIVEEPVNIVEEPVNIVEEPISIELDILEDSVIKDVSAIKSINSLSNAMLVLMSLILLSTVHLSKIRNNK